MPRQSGMSFDSVLMEEIRVIRGYLQGQMPEKTITNTDIMRYLIDLHNKRNEVCNHSNLSSNEMELIINVT